MALNTNHFPGYIFVPDPGGNPKKDQNIYHGENVGKGGLVIAKPGMYGKCLTLDVASLHPHSMIELNLFGEYTQRFKEIVEARVAIKHKDYDTASKMLDGVLAPYLTNPADAKAVANALKTAINSVYGLTSASFDNPFKDPRNRNNIVALRGALFMYDLYLELNAMGYNAFAVRTDSIKIADYDDRALNYAFDKAKTYGYTFEVEHKFDRICLVNNAVYIAKLADDDPEAPGKWTATGAEFAEPYIFKTLFTHEPLDISDLGLTKSVSKGAIYLHHLDDSYEFIGNVGQFTPVKAEMGGCELLRKSDDGKFTSVTGAKGYTWMETSQVKFLGSNYIDMSYFEKKAQDSIEKICKYGDFNAFASGAPLIVYNNNEEAVMENE